MVFHGLGMNALGGAVPDRHALSLPQPRLASRACCFSAPGRCCMPRVSATSAARRADPSHALGRLAHACRRAGNRWLAAAEWFCVRVAATAGVLVRDTRCRGPSSTCCCRSARRSSRLCAALAGYVMVKFFGVIFLGQPRETSLGKAHEASVSNASAWYGSRSAASRSACSRRR